MVEIIGIILANIADSFRIFGLRFNSRSSIHSKFGGLETPLGHRWIAGWAKKVGRSASKAITFVHMTTLVTR